MFLVSFLLKYFKIAVVYDLRAFYRIFSVLYYTKLHKNSEPKISRNNTKFKMNKTKIFRPNPVFL